MRPRLLRRPRLLGQVSHRHIVSPERSLMLHIMISGADLISAGTLGLDQPVILGEFGELSAQGEAHQATVVQNFLSKAKSGGWAGALCESSSQGPPKDIDAGCRLDPRGTRLQRWTQYLP